MLAVKPVVEFVHDEDCGADKYHTDNGFESVCCECQRDAYQWIHIDRFHHCLTGKSAARHPYRVVAEYLTHHSAQIQNCKCSKHRCQYDTDKSFLIFQTNSSVPGQALLPPCPCR